MAADWLLFCKDNRCSIEDNGAIRVEFDDGRTHRVYVTQTPDAWELKAVVASARFASSIEDLVLKSWVKNRVSDLVGYRLERGGRLVADAWVPRAGTTAETFMFQVLMLAREADRFEFNLTGADRL